MNSYHRASRASNQTRWETIRWKMSPSKDFFIDIWIINFDIYLFLLRWYRNRVYRDLEFPFRNEASSSNASNNVPILQVTSLPPVSSERRCEISLSKRSFSWLFHDDWNWNLPFIFLICFVVGENLMEKREGVSKFLFTVVIFLIRDLFDFVCAVVT